MEQFVFFCVNVSVAAVKIESSMFGVDPDVAEPPLSFAMASAPEDAEGMALGSCEDVFSAGPSSLLGEDGGVGYAFCAEALDSQTERKLSRPLTFGRRNW